MNIESKNQEIIDDSQEAKSLEFDSVDEKSFEEEVGLIRNLLTPSKKSESKEAQQCEKEEKIKKIIDNANILNKALQIKSKFYESLSALNWLTSQDPELLNLALSIIENNLIIIESYIKSDRNLFNCNCLEALNNLAAYGNARQQEVGVKALINHTDALVFSMNFDPPHFYFPFIETLVKGNDSEIAQKALSILENTLSDKRGGFIDYLLLSKSFTSSEKNIRKTADAAIEKELASYGLDTTKFFDAWRVSIPLFIDFQEVLNIGEILENNIQTIKDVEAQRPGAISLLSKEFGILDFGRYPAEMLISQYDNYNNNEKPYGVIFYPRDDSNGAFYYNIRVFKQLFEQLNGIGFDIRVMEGEDKIDIVKLLHKLDRKYGKKHKISFAIIGGHGSWDSVKFGGNDKKHTLNMLDLFDKKHPVSIRKKFFEDSPTFILNSCSTGAKYGIAEQLSSEMRATVIAPDEPTSAKAIDVEMKDGKLNFSVKYQKQGISQTYVAGKSKDYENSRN